MNAEAKQLKATLPNGAWRESWKTYQLQHNTIDIFDALRMVMRLRRAGRLILHLDDGGRLTGAEWMERVPKNATTP
jgi:hypothetical protein